MARHVVFGAVGLARPLVATCLYQSTFVVGPACKHQIWHLENVKMLKLQQLRNALSNVDEINLVC